VTFTDESGEEIEFSGDPEEWFINAGYFSLRTPDASGMIRGIRIDEITDEVLMVAGGDRINLLFIVDDEEYEFGFGPGTLIAAEEADGGYFLLPDETVVLSPPQEGASPAPVSVIDDRFSDIEWNGDEIIFKAGEKITITGVSLFSDGIEYAASYISNTSGDMGNPNGAIFKEGSGLAMKDRVFILFEDTVVECSVKNIDGEPDFVRFYLEGGEEIEFDL